MLVLNNMTRLQQQQQEMQHQDQDMLRLREKQEEAPGQQPHPSPGQSTGGVSGHNSSGLGSSMHSSPLREEARKSVPRLVGKPVVLGLWLSCKKTFTSYLWEGSQNYKVWSPPSPLTLTRIFLN